VCQTPLPSDSSSVFRRLTGFVPCAGIGWRVAECPTPLPFRDKSQSVRARCNRTPRSLPINKIGTLASYKQNRDFLLHALLLFRGGGVSHGYCRELAHFGAVRAALLFNGACARAVFATVGRGRCSQRVGAGTFVREGMNTLRPTGLATRNEAPVGTVLGGLGGVSNTIAI